MTEKRYPSASLSRRRALTIVAAAAALPVIAGAAASHRLERRPVHRWQGAALGAKCQMLLAHPDERKVRRILAACLAEIDRLEGIFSLYRVDSELVRVNAAGRLQGASPELVGLAMTGRNFSALTGGAFDITVQPLWRLLAEWRGGGQAPDQNHIDNIRALVDYRAIDIGRNVLAFRKPGMAITFNGIAQGYITDRITDLLRDAGFDDVLVQLGESYALSPRESGAGWPIAIAGSAANQPAVDEILLKNRALASSNRKAMLIGGAPHILDPRNAAAATGCLSATVLAPNATIADALSTALCVAPAADAPRLLYAGGGERAWIDDGSGMAKIVEPAPA